MKLALAILMDVQSWAPTQEGQCWKVLVLIRFGKVAILFMNAEGSN